MTIPVAHSTSNKIKKGSVILLPILLIIGGFHLFLPYVKTSYISARTGLTAYSASGIQVFAGDQEIREEVVNTYDRFRRAFKEQYGDVLHFDRVPPGRILIFEDSTRFEQYFSSKWQENLPNNSGYYDPTSGEIAIVNPGQKSLLRRAVRHEATHMFLRTAAPGGDRDWSPWFDEGFASVYEHMYRLEDGEGQIGGFGRDALLHLIHSLSGESGDAEDGGWIPLENLVRANHNRFRSKGNRQYYYQSKALVFYLLKNRPRPFRELFLRESNSEHVPPRTIEALLEQDLEDLDRELREWLRNQQVGGDLLTLDGGWIRFINGTD